MRVLILYLGLGLLFACHSRKEQVVETDMTDEFIIEVMSDLYIAQSAIKNIEPTKVDSIRSLYRSQIEQIHKIDLEEFEKILALLQMEADRYSKLHQAVDDTLAFRSKRLD